MKLLSLIPEHLRGKFYFGVSLVLFVLLIALIIYAVFLGDDPGEWALWIVTVLGLGSSSLANANTNRKR